MNIATPELLTANVSTRVISGSWLLWRATQINNGVTPIAGCSSIEQAVSEAEQILYERMHNNLREGGETIIVRLSEEPDSDVIIVIPIDNRKKREKDLEKPRIPVEAIPLQFDLRDEFEQHVIAGWQSSSLPEDLFKRDEGTGRYLYRGMNSRWVGFRMCYTALIKPYRAMKECYQRIFANFIIGEVTPTGQVLFQSAPYRHRSMSSAYKEVNRLVNLFHKPYAIFRCIDIVDTPKVIRENPNEKAE